MGVSCAHLQSASQPQPKTQETLQTFQSYQTTANVPVTPSSSQEVISNALACFSDTSEILFLLPEFVCLWVGDGKEVVM